jgi:hypothetical protein
MKVGITTFKGTVPGIHPRLLPEDHGTIAENVRLDDGSLTPTREAKRVHTFPDDCGSFFRRPSGAWLGFGGVVDAVRGAVDANRTYVTGDGDPKIWVSDVQSINMALPAPTRVPTANIYSGEVDNDTSTESVFAFTYVTSLGEESAPSPVSNIIEWSPGCIIRVANLQPVNPDPARLLTGMRIYRSVTDTLGTTTLFFVAEVGFQSSYLNATSADDTISDTAEAIPSMDYDTPPPTMQGITSMPNGMMVAFSGQEVLFCEPYIHHAWPIKYRLKVDSQIVGLGVFGSSVVILTTGNPYIAQGTHPSSMVMERIEVDLPCIAASSIVDMGYSVFYASTDGLVQVSQSGAQVMSMQLFTREEWARMRPSTFFAARLRGRYVFSYVPPPGPAEDPDSIPRRLGIVDVSDQQPFFINDDARFSYLWYEIESGQLYGLFDGTGVVRWDDLNEPRKRMRWRSKPIHLPTPTNFGVIRVDGDDGRDEDIATRVYAGRPARLVREVRGRNRVERLPSGFTEEIWEIEVEGVMPVTAIFLAHAPSELAE